MLSFLAAPEMIGVTSMCRFWQGNEAVYHRFLHFCRSKAYDLETLLATWQGYVWRQAVAVQVAGRAVLLGDHTLVVKDGGVCQASCRYMTLQKPSTSHRTSAGTAGARSGWWLAHSMLVFVCL
ncbi:MAG: hypothetical protein H6973_19665 [Gammaproteobacteria bacterium]|nr:hypothetical protein [Gammaproteobacteria bacterium]MCP5127744.1 hypothetical protein [Gammaproteobacteria bacterium]